MSHELHSLFVNLFWGRTDRLGMNVDGQEQSAHVDPRKVDQAMRAHLTDPNAPIVGVYPVTPDGLTQWGCFDFDSATSNPGQDAMNCLEALRMVGLDGVVEVSRSGEGRHVWVFADDFIPALTMRKALLFVDHAAELECNEINPKQRLERAPVDYRKTIGNYVRLPYHAGHATMRALDEGTGELLDLESFLSKATRCSHAQLKFVASRWHNQPPPRREVEFSLDARKSESSREPTQDAELILRGDIVEHGGGFVDGRNNKLYSLAKYMAVHPRYDRAAAEGIMTRVHEEQLVQEPDFIALPVLLDMVRRSFDEIGE